MSSIIYNITARYQSPVRLGKPRRSVMDIHQFDSKKNVQGSTRPKVNFKFGSHDIFSCESGLVLVGTDSELSTRVAGRNKINEWNMLNYGYVNFVNIL